MHNQNQISFTVQSNAAIEARKRRLIREALGPDDAGEPSSPMHASFVVAVIIAVLGGGTALMDDGGLGEGYAQMSQARKVTVATPTDSLKPVSYTR